MSFNMQIVPLARLEGSRNAVINLELETSIFCKDAELNFYNRDLESHIKVKKKTCSRMNVFAQFKVSNAYLILLD